MSTPQLRTAGEDSHGGNARFAASRSMPAAAGRGNQLAERRRRVLIGVLVLAIVAGGAWALLASSLLVVRHIEVTGNRLVTAAQVRLAARIKTGVPLASVDTGAAARRVEQLAAVLSATVRRSWPNAIVITVRERTAVFAVAAAGRYQLVDRHGITVRWATRKPASLPLLSSPPAVLRGSSAVYAAADVFRQLTPSLRKRIMSVSAASAGSVTLHMTRSVTVLWGSAANPAQKLAELGMLLRRHARYYDISDPSSAVTAG